MANCPRSRSNIAFLTLFPKVRNDFRVAMGVQAMPARCQLRALLEVIEQLAVEDHEDAPVLVGHRLLAVRQADDAEPPRGQCQPGPMEKALLVRAAMHQRSRHPFDHALGHRPPATKIHDARDATHSSSQQFGPRASLGRRR